MTSEEQLSGIDVILYRLDRIEIQVNQLMSKDVYLSEHEALKARVTDVETEITNNRSKNNQIMISAISPIITFILGIISAIIFNGV